MPVTMPVPSLSQFDGVETSLLHAFLRLHTQIQGAINHLFEHFPNSRNMSLRVQRRFWGSKKIWMPPPAAHSV
jgi:hypothetical protein